MAVSNCIIGLHIGMVQLLTFELRKMRQLANFDLVPRYIRVVRTAI